MLARLETDAQTRALMEAAQASGRVWFGPSSWAGRMAIRLSVSSWRTQEVHIDAAIELLTRLRAGRGQ